MTRVLIDHLLRAVVFVVPAAAALAWMVLGPEVALGVIVGAALSLADGAALVYLVGRLLDPTVEGSKKAAFLAFLFAKLAVVGGLLWAALSLGGVSGLGVIIGIGVGLLALMLGVTRGAASDAGKRAIEEEEARIREELGDNEPDPS